MRIQLFPLAFVIKAELSARALSAIPGFSSIGGGYPEWGECLGEVPGEFGVFFRGLGGAGCLLFFDLGLVTRVVFPL